MASIVGLFKEFWGHHSVDENSSARVSLENGWGWDFLPRVGCKNESLVVRQQRIVIEMQGRERENEKEIYVAKCPVPLMSGGRFNYHFNLVRLEQEQQQYIAQRPPTGLVLWLLIMLEL